MRRATPQHFYAFDVLWLAGRDLRALSLLERKRMLRRLVPPQQSPMLSVDHVGKIGADLYRVVFECDMEGICASARTRDERARHDDVDQDQEPALQSGGSREGRFLQHTDASAN
jgi:bifunctional non-homologous end joining protein LigD